MIRAKIVKAVQSSLKRNSYNYIDNVTFCFDFGEGELVDKDGDSYFVHVEYHLNTGEWVFENWYEDETCKADLDPGEERYIKAVIKELL